MAGACAVTIGVAASKVSERDAIKAGIANRHHGGC
jgi:hypothetical protein